MTTGPVVTLAVITYNRKNRLIATMERMRKQTYQPIEWLVVDGGSTDGTADWLRENAERYGFRYVSERDSGEYEALNKAARMATGRYIKFFSDDDLLHEDAIAAYVAFAEAHPEADLFFARARSFQLLPGDQRADLGLSCLFRPQDCTVQRLVRHDTVMNSMTAFLRMTVFERIGPFRMDWVGGDWEYWVRAAKAGLQFAQLDQVTIDYQFTLDNGVSRRAFRIAGEGLMLARQYGSLEDLAVTSWRFRESLLGVTQLRNSLARAFHQRGLRPGKWLRDRAAIVRKVAGLH